MLEALHGAFRCVHPVEDFRNVDDYLQFRRMNVGYESRPDKLAHRRLIVFLGAAHTTTMAGTHVIYDLCAMPEYVEPLRAEISALLKEEGGWSPAVPNKMRKVDSFFGESQRCSPASLRETCLRPQRANELKLTMNV